MGEAIRIKTVLLAIVVVLASCYTNTDKSKAKQQNNDRFADSGVTRDANFLVNAIDESYAILEIAEIGENEFSNPQFLQRAREIMEAQTSVAVKLKSFADRNEMAIPLSGPAKTKLGVGDLQGKKGRELEREWSRQMKIHHQRLINDLTRYRSRSGADLRRVLDSTLVLMNENKERILALNEFDGD